MAGGTPNCSRVQCVTQTTLIIYIPLWWGRGGGGGGGREQKKNNCNHESQKATRPDFKRKALKTNEILRRDEGVPAYLR